MSNIPTFDTWSATAASNQPDGSDSATFGADLQQIQATIRQNLATKGATIASAATVNMAAATGNFVDVSGTTTITAFGTLTAGMWKIVRFTGVLTLTHNATSLILPTSANITTANGDACYAISLGGGNWQVMFYQRANGSSLDFARGSVAMHATTMNLWVLPITIDGTGSAVTITAIANAPQAGAKRTLYPITGTIITNNAMFDVQGNASYTTKAGDALVFTAITTTTYDVDVIAADGLPIATVDSYVRLNTANGYGSTNLNIRRFTNIVNQAGGDITYADSATLGATFTINTSGIYSMSFSDQFNISGGLGFSLNSASLSTGIGGIPVSEILGACQTSAANIASCASFIGFIAAGGVVRAHTAGVPSGTAPTFCQFSIARVS